MGMPSKEMQQSVTAFFAVGEAIPELVSLLLHLSFLA